MIRDQNNLFQVQTESARHGSGMHDSAIGPVAVRFQRGEAVIAGHDLALRQASVARQPRPTVVGQFVGM
jgi:hypothetical protein